MFRQSQIKSESLITDTFMETKDFRGRLFTYALCTESLSNAE